MTTVVRLKRKGGVVVQGCDVYIGRACFYGGWNLNQSCWANPFTVKQYGDKAIEMYEDYIRKSPLINDVFELQNKVLGCWCHPNPCHGDVLIKILNERQSSTN